jgi:hypothetical protein
MSKTVGPVSERITQTTRELVAAGADPALVRFLASQAWHAGWVAGWAEHDDRKAMIRNPYFRG